MQRDEFNEEQLETVLGGIPYDVAKDKIHKSEIREHIEKLEKAKEIIISQSVNNDYDKSNSSKRGGR